MAQQLKADKLAEQNDKLVEFAWGGYSMAMGYADPDAHDDYIADWNAFLANAAQGDKK